MTAIIGDYVTTTAETYELERSFDGVPFFKPVGIRQGVLTGRFYSKFDTELSGLDCILYEVLGEAGTYAIPYIHGLVKVDYAYLPSSIKKTIEDLYETCYPMQMMRLMKRAFEIDSSINSWDGSASHWQDEFFKAYLATGMQAVGRR